MQKKKMEIVDLEIKSFITSLPKGNLNGAGVVAFQPANVTEGLGGGCITAMEETTCCPPKHIVIGNN